MKQARHPACRVAYGNETQKGADDTTICGGENLQGTMNAGRAPSLTHKNAQSNGVLPHVPGGKAHVQGWDKAWRTAPGSGQEAA